MELAAANPEQTFIYDRLDGLCCGLVHRQAKLLWRTPGTVATEPYSSGVSRG